MAPSPPSSSHSTADSTTLADIGAELHSMAAQTVTNQDMATVFATLHEAIHAEVTALKAEVYAHDFRLLSQETCTQALTDEAHVTNNAITWQGSMLLALRRQLEELVNRSCRSNIRVHWVQETQGLENAEEVLSSLFCLILISLPLSGLSRHTKLQGPEYETDLHAALFAVSTCIK
ncbi:Hypothetical predicted protein [Pelobates cultripes]|uniref:Uncharacterized protein n=1 Tax=Pelobates cultripes TaxID=61616 RepID=A0AAD1RA24_PELCU|nr:Hypothetical predicted protein [Pelobates cultripes]